MDEIETQNPVSPETEQTQEQTVPPVMPPNAVPPPMSEYPRGPQYVPGPPTNANDDAMRFVIPLNPSALAVIAGYVGMFSILAIPAPFAILFGVLALRDLKRHPEKTGSGRAWFGIIVGTFFTLIFGFFLVASLMDPKR